MLPKRDRETGHRKSASDKSIVSTFSFGNMPMVITSNPSINQSVSPVRLVGKSVKPFGQKEAYDMRLSREEQETIINFNAGEKTATLYTRDPAVMRKLDQLVISFPEVYKCIGETDIDKTYEMPKSAVTYRKLRRLSEEQREVARERLMNIKNS